MEYKVNFNIRSFEFWSGAKDRVQDLTLDQLDSLGEYIEEVFYGETPTETQINDFVWFECDDFINELTEEEEK